MQKLVIGLEPHESRSIQAVALKFCPVWLGFPWLNDLTQSCAVCDAIKRGSGGSSGQTTAAPRPRLTTECAQASARGKKVLR